MTAGCRSIGEMFAVALALMLAPAAHAVSCGELKSLNEYARDDFQFITGEAIDRNHFEAIYTLGGARGCTLDLVYDSIFVCEWSYPDAAAANTAFDAQSASLAKCLADWSPTVRAGQASFDGAGDAAKLRWTARMIAPADPAATWRVAVSLTYVWSGRPA